MTKTSTETYVIGTQQVPLAIASGNVTSLPTSLKKLDNVSYQYNVGGTLVGTVTVQTSNDYVQNSDGTINYAGNWVTIPSFSGSINGVGAGVLELVTMPELWIRTIFSYTSGTGTLSCAIDAKSGL